MYDNCSISQRIEQVRERVREKERVRAITTQKESIFFFNLFIIATNQQPINLNWNISFYFLFLLLSHFIQSVSPESKKYNIDD
jgi:hypothetical protein